MSRPSDRKAREAEASREIDRLHDADEARVLRGLLRFPPGPGPAVHGKGGTYRPVHWAGGRGAPLTPEQFAAAQRLRDKGLIEPVVRDLHLIGWTMTERAAELAEGIDLADEQYRRRPEPTPPAAAAQPSLFPVAA